MLNGLPTFFMAEKFPLKLHAKIYYGKLGTSSVKFDGISANLEPQYALVWRFSAIPAGSFEARAANSDHKAALWPRSFCMDFARTFGRSKSQLWSGPGHVSERVPAESGKKVTERSFETWCKRKVWSLSLV